MKVLTVHVAYRQHGGEDKVFLQENELLRNEGIDVQPLLLSNMSIQDDGLGAKLAIGIGTTWSLKGYQQTREVIAGFRPDLVHFHNTFPQLSPQPITPAEMQECLLCRRYTIIACCAQRQHFYAMGAYAKIAFPCDFTIQ